MISFFFFTHTHAENGTAKQSLAKCMLFAICHKELYVSSLSSLTCHEIRCLQVLCACSKLVHCFVFASFFTSTNWISTSFHMYYCIVYHFQLCYFVHSVFYENVHAIFYIVVDVFFFLRSRNIPVLSQIEQKRNNFTIEMFVTALIELQE